jgi:transposase
MSTMKAVFTTAVGIDVHRDTVVVSVRKKGPAGGDDPVETRTFETFRDDLVKMTEWLAAEGAEVVGLESTGVYWMPIVRVIQEQLPKLVVWLVNPLEVKGRAGRKTDRKDSRRMSELVLYGQVTPSFVPSYLHSELRKLTRHRTKLVADKTRYTNRIIKELEGSGVKLASVLSDCLGKSGRAMIDALLEGKPTTDVAQLAKGLLRKKIPLIQRAVDGAFTPSTTLVLRQLLKLLDDVTTQLSAVDEEISKLMQPWQADRDLIVTSPGIEAVSSAAVLAEMGSDMALFPSAKHLTAWAGLAPGSEESAGKAKSAPARKGNKYLRTVLVQCAWAAVKTKGAFWTAAFRRLRARLGPKKAIVAIARKMLVALFHILSERVPYRDPDPLPSSPHHRERLMRRLLGKIEALGYSVHITSPPSGIPAEAVS